jgi:Protein of unknown function (DUF3987)
MSEHNPRSRAGQSQTLSEWSESNGSSPDPLTSNGHASSNGSSVADTIDRPAIAAQAPGSVVFVTIERELADAMNAVALPAVYHLDDRVKQRVDQLRAVVVYRRKGDIPCADQTAMMLLTRCHCERVAKLDLSEMNFEGEPDEFVAWFEDAIGMGRFEHGGRFTALADQWAKAVETRFSFEPTDDELSDPIGNVDPVAFHGVLGEIVTKLGPVTEANRLFILAHLLAMCGASMGRDPKFARGIDAYMNPQFVLIGPTAKGRKRTSRVIAEKAFRRADKNFVDNNILDGLSSGRGLMENLRDSSTRIGDKGKEIYDPGVIDKRRLFIEEEIGSVLKHGNRDSETLLTIFRQFADGKEKIHMATKSPITVTGAHLSVLGHGTPSETRSLLMDRERSGGTSNRFIWLWGVKARDLPGGADVDDVVENFLSDEIAELASKLKAAKTAGSIMFAPKIADRWAKVYRKLEDDTPSGPIAEHYARGPTNVIRLASLFALLDGGPKIEIGGDHLDAALAIWGHADRTLRYMFASDVNEDAEKLKAALRKSPGGLTKTQITRDVFKGRPPIGVNDVLKDLLAERTILAKKVIPESGRHATLFIWNPWT